MFELVQSWFAPKVNPIGVDFGSDALRLAQVQWVDGECRIIAAASADVPAHVRHDPVARLNFFVETMRDLLTEGNFRGRQAIIALPAASMFIQHFRLPKMDDDAIKKALPWEARGKLPIDPTHALMRHVVAGEIFNEQEPKYEVIVMAASRDTVTQVLASASRARLDVVGMNVEASALMDCFGHLYKRKSDAGAVNLFVDIGCSGSRAIISQESNIMFARNIPVGGEHLTRAVAAEMKISLDQAKALRMKVAAEHASNASRARLQDETEAEAANSTFALLKAAMKPGEASVLPAVDRRRGAEGGDEEGAVKEAAPACSSEAALVDQASLKPLGQLVEELELCRRYHESTFPNRAVDRLIFVGGEARNTRLCQVIADEIGLPGQVGDPMVQLGEHCGVDSDSGLDPTQPQPNWAVALGLTLGPVAVRQAVEAA